MKYPDQIIRQLIILLLIIMTFLAHTSKALFFLKFRKFSPTFSPSNICVRFLSSSTINESDNISKNIVKTDEIAANPLGLTVKKPNNIKKDVTLDENVKVKQKITLLEKDLDEKFVRGSGNGGQKINTTSNRVQLTHIPTGISVSCQDARDLSTNRKIARKSLIDKLDLHFNGAESKLGIAHEKIRKKKKNAKRFVRFIHTCSLEHKHILFYIFVSCMKFVHLCIYTV